MSKNNCKRYGSKVKNGPIFGMGGQLEDDQQNGVDNNEYYLDVDPDLPADVEINLPKNRRASATTMSAKSRKTGQSGRQSEIREKIKSRGRPIKPHEVEPFLSINTMPPEKSVVSETIAASNAAHSRAYRLEREASDDSRSLEAQVQRMSACLSPFNPQNAAAPRSVPSRTGRITPANTPYRSPNKSVRPANHHVKSPFKHAVNQPEIGQDERLTPSMGMKERTALAAFHVHRMLSVASVKDAFKVSGKLQKGKLKSLYPVTVEGPKIDNCRGIVSETRSYQPSPSRTLQRRVNLINKIPNVHEYLYERPRTVESVHQTSVASSIDGLDVDHPDSNRSLPDEILYAQETPIVEPKTPENTFLPEPTQDDIVEGIQTMGVDATSKMFDTEVNSRLPERAGRVQQELYLAQSAEMLQDTDDVISGDRNDSNSMENDKIEADEQHLNADSRARIGSPSKSVRFAEQKEKRAELQSSKEMKEIVNENIAQQQRDINCSGIRNLADVNDDELNDSVIETVSRKNKQNSKGSCKSNDIDTIFKKDEDDDDDVYDRRNAEDDNRKQESNQNTGNSNQTSDSKGGFGKNNSQNGGQERAASVPQTGIRVSSISEPRSEDIYMRNSGNNSQIRKALLGTVSSKRPLSIDRHCSRFEPSKASKAHINTLDVSSVIHGDCVTAVLQPDCSKIGSIGANGMHRHKEQTCQKAKPCTETIDDFDILYGNSRRECIQFMLEGEKLGLDTIFLEDEVNLRGDKEIADDVLDHSKDEKVESVTDSESETVITETDNMDTIRGDYSNLLEKYRQQCLDRSEMYGAISNSLVTPRDTQSMISNRPCSQNQEMRKKLSGVIKGDNESIHRETVSATQYVNTTMLSDSGHGSVDSLSDLSCSASRATSDVLRLELGGSTSDLSLGSGRSDMTITSSNQEDIGAEKQKDRKLLEVVCDQLSPIAQGQKPARRRQIDEDLSNLKLIATTKSLSKSSKLRGKNYDEPQALFPPLCFTINARPPQGYLYYFAYGPDMNPNRLSSYVQRDIEDRYWGLLLGFNLVFNKRGTSVEAGGFSNIEFNPLRSVEGCIYKITPHELHILDKCVGYPEHYEHLVLPVWLSNGSGADNPDVAQYCVPALTYIAQNQWTETERALNCDYALSQCIKSADLVSTAYKESLVSMATQQVTASA